jgi:hypothetical protein
MSKEGCLNLLESELKPCYQPINKEFFKLLLLLGHSKKEFKRVKKDLWVWEWLDEMS